MNNNIPRILKAKGWTPYQLWQALGGQSMSNRTLAYKLSKPAEPLDAKKWATMCKVAEVLEVPLPALIANGEVEIRFQPGYVMPAGNGIPNILAAKGWTRYQLWQALDPELKSSARALAYALGNPEEPLAQKQWGTMLRVAAALGVSIEDLAG